MFDRSTTFTPVQNGMSVGLMLGRAMDRFNDDTMHHLSHTLEGGNDGCPTCAVVAERIRLYEIENPKCACDCCGHDA